MPTSATRLQPPGSAGLRGVSSRTWLWPTLVVGLGLAFGVHQGLWRFLGDDAFISFRYAAQWAQLGEPRFNPEPWPAVEGYSNPGWVAALAMLSLLGLAPDDAAPVLTTGCSALGLVLACAVLGRMRRMANPQLPSQQPWRDPIDLLAACLLIATPNYVVWAHGGLEGAACLAAGLACILLWSCGRLGASAVAGVAALSLRLDAGLWICAFLITDALLHSGLRGQAEGRPPAWLWSMRHTRALAIVGCGLTVLFGARWLYYGNWLPNTWAIKSHGSALRWDWGSAYLRAWIDDLQIMWLVPLSPWIRPRHLPILAMAVAACAWAWTIGGDFMAYHRFLLPATVAVAILVPWLALDAATALGERVHRPAMAISVAVAATLAFAAAWAIEIAPRWRADRSTDWLDRRWESVTSMHRFAAIRLAAGREMAWRVPADTLVSVGAAGAFPYASRLPALDSYGLVAPHWIEGLKPRTGAGARPGHQLQAPLRRILADEPGLMCHIGWAATRAPNDQDLRRRIGRRGGYAWLCVQTGAIVDHRAPGGAWPNHHYCCIARRAIIAGQGDTGG